jgi:3-oxo-5-alpha-steroid 4-dehydrogenase 3
MDNKHLVTRLLDWIASITVPHSWFIHFYLLAGSLTLFWAFEISTKRFGLFDSIASSANLSYTTSMTRNQTVLVFGLFSAHVLRRLVEQSSAPASSSRMSILHWMMGLSFYLFMSIAIWIERSREGFEITFLGMESSRTLHFNNKLNLGFPLRT